MSDVKIPEALTAREVQALKEVSGYPGLYWFRIKTMTALETRGLVEKWLPPSVAERSRMKARPWRITTAGTKALNAAIRSSHE